MSAARRSDGRGSRAGTLALGVLLLMAAAQAARAQERPPVDTVGTRTPRAHTFGRRTPDWRGDHWQTGSGPFQAGHYGGMVRWRGPATACFGPAAGWLRGEPYFGYGYRGRPGYGRGFGFGRGYGGYGYGGYDFSGRYGSGLERGIPFGLDGGLRYWGGPGAFPRVRGPSPWQYAPAYGAGGFGAPSLWRRCLPLPWVTGAPGGFVDPYWGFIYTPHRFYRRFHPSQSGAGAGERGSAGAPVYPPARSYPWAQPYAPPAADAGSSCVRVQVSLENGRRYVGRLTLPVYGARTKGDVPLALDARLSSGREFVLVGPGGYPIAILPSDVVSDIHVSSCASPQSH